MNYCVYVLRSLKDGKLYIGRTNNLKRRLREHNSGKVSSTKYRKPFILLEQATVSSEAESIKLELEYKKGYKREQLKQKHNIS